MVCLGLARHCNCKHSILATLSPGVRSPGSGFRLHLSILDIYLPISYLLTFFNLSISLSLSLSLSIYLSVYLSIHLSHTSSCRSTYLVTYLSIYLYLSVCRTIYRSTSLPIDQYLYPSIQLSICPCRVRGLESCRESGCQGTAQSSTTLGAAANLQNSLSVTSGGGGGVVGFSINES